MGQIFIAILIAIAVSVDNFIISVSFGLALPKIKNKTILRTSAFFAGSSLALYLIGWEAGIYLHDFLEHDHWFASAFLFFIGIRMIISALSKKKNSVNPDTLLNFKMLTLFSLATSMDALIIGMSTSLSSIQSVYPAVSIPLFVFLVTFSGLKTGKTLSAKRAKTMQILGGCIIILLGLKVLISG